MATSNHNHSLDHRVMMPRGSTSRFWVIYHFLNHPMESADLHGVWRIQLQARSALVECERSREQIETFEKVHLIVTKK